MALGTTLALSPTLALADAVAEKLAQAHEQQVSVLDLGAANTADPEPPEGAANPQVPEPPVAPANPSSGQDPQPIDPSPVNPDPDPPIPQTPSPWSPPGGVVGSLPATAPGTTSPPPAPWSPAGGRSPSTSTSSPPAAECTRRDPRDRRPGPRGGRVPSPGGGLCSEWVSEVFEAAGYRHVYADACDDYWWFCNSGNISDLKVGMIIAVPSHTHSYLASIYGHV